MATRRHHGYSGLLAVLLCVVSVATITHLADAKTRQHFNFTWPAKKAAEVEGDLLLGGLMMVHEREDHITCGPIMPQGGIQVPSKV